MSEGVTEAVQRVLEAVADEGGRTAADLGAVYQAELAGDRRGRQQAAAFYTPRHLVDFVLEIGLAPALRERDADEILALRVVDPACGSGVFLEAALEMIEAALIGRGHQGGAALRARASRCLRGVDVDPVAVALCRIALDAACGGQSAAAIEHGDSLLVDHPPCDVVLTNPPWGQKHLRFDAAARALLRQRFDTARGVLDPFKLFIELAHRVLADGGRWAMVLPDIVLLKNHEPTRRLMLSSSAIEWIAHVGRAFKEVNLDACVIAARKQPPPPDHEVNTLTSLERDWREKPLAPRRRAQRVFASLSAARLNIVASDDDLARVRRLDELPRLDDTFEVHEGVHSGNRRRALFLAGPRAPSTPMIVGGREAAPFQLRWAGRFLDLDPDAIGRDDGGYANLGRIEWHLRKKIVVRRTGDRMVVSFDAIGRAVSNNFFVVVPRRPMSDAEQRAAAAMLGSSMMTWYFRTISPRVGRLFAELKIHQLSEFPMAELSAAETKALAGLVAELERPMLRRENRLALEAALDRQVAAAYDRMIR